MKSLKSYLQRDGKLTRIRIDAPVLDDACAADAPDLPYIRGFQEGALRLSARPSAGCVCRRHREMDSSGAKLEFVIHYAPR